MKIRRIARFILFAAVLLTTVSACCDCHCCDEPPAPGEDWRWYRTLVEANYDRDWYIPVSPRADWRRDWPEGLGRPFASLELPMPKGLRVTTFAGEDAKMYNVSAQGGEVPMSTYTTDLLFYNNDTQYIVVVDPESFANATAMTRVRNAGSYAGNPRVGTDVEPEPVCSSPDLLYRAALSASKVDSLEAVMDVDPDSLRLIDVTLVPGVYTYAVHFQFESGLEYVLSAAGAMTGLAQGVNLSTGRTVDDRCTMLFDCTKTDGGITGVLTTFGVPGYTPGGELYGPEGRYGITLQAVLTNGRHVSFNLDISAQISAQPAGGVVIVGPLSIDPADAQPDGGSGTGGFEVNVNPWGAPTDIEINL